MKTSSIAMIRALRDEFEHRVMASEDYRALVALDHQLAAFERVWRSPPVADADGRSHLRLMCFDGPRDRARRDPVQADF